MTVSIFAPFTLDNLLDYDAVFVDGADLGLLLSKWTG